MTYEFKTTFTIDITGEIEADSYEDALTIAEKITAKPINDNGIQFNIPGEADYTEIEIDDLPDIDVNETY